MRAGKGGGPRWATAGRTMLVALISVGVTIVFNSPSALFPASAQCKWLLATGTRTRFTTVTQSPASSSPILLCMCSLLLQVVARYGYQDEVDHSDPFISKLISTILHKLEMKAGLRYGVGAGVVTRTSR